MTTQESKFSIQDRRMDGPYPKRRATVGGTALFLIGAVLGSGIVINGDRIAKAAGDVSNFFRHEAAYCATVNPNNDGTPGIGPRDIGKTRQLLGDEYLASEDGGETVADQKSAEVASNILGQGGTPVVCVYATNGSVDGPPKTRAGFPDGEKTVKDNNPVIVIKNPRG